MKYKIHYDPKITQKSIDVLASFLMMFGSIVSQSTREHYVIFNTILTIDEMKARLGSIKKIAKIEEYHAN